MLESKQIDPSVMVALRKESVDRNVFLTLTVRNVPVALRKESVDRNLLSRPAVGSLITSLSARRAWIEIIAFGVFLTCMKESLSARRAWIEIKSSIEEVSKYVSLSARRAWIEIIDDLEPSSTRKVALRKESVDRNKRAEPSGQAQCRRSPQGERG